MLPTHRKIVLFIVVVLGLAAITIYWRMGKSTAAPVVPLAQLINVTPTSTFTPALIPKIIPIDESPLKDSIIAAGDYLVRQQLSNGELSYQVDFKSGERGYSPSYIRLIGGTGSLFTVCRVSGDSKYCKAGDLALDHYLEQLVSDPKNFTGTCLYKKWQLSTGRSRRSCRCHLQTLAGNR